MEDYLIRGVAAGGLVTFSAAHTASLAERARQIHGLQPLAAAALGVLIVNKRRRRGREALFVNRKAAMEAAEPIQEQEDTAK